MEKKTTTLEGYSIIEKRVAVDTNSGRIYVPKSWIGKRVVVVLLEDVED